MCSTCGCGHDEQGPVILNPAGQPEEADILQPGQEHSHHHPHTPHTPGRTLVEVEQEVLLQNDLLAQRNRGFFEARGITAINLVSSPGSGKTTLLETTLRDLAGRVDFYVIEGDQQTLNDARRIDALQVPVRQINTGKGCHLDSAMVYRAYRDMELAKGGILFIENVGNLVCPALFDLGENYRVVIISTTEGDDKPVKYPDMFARSQLCLINKTDLLPYVNFDVKKAREYARQVNPGIHFIEVSATTGAGMEEWYEWLLSNRITPSS